MRRLGAVATLVWDHIENPFADPPLREQWGGAVYSFSSLSAALPDGWVVEPIVKIGADLWERGGELLRRLPGLDPGAGVVHVQAENNRVALHYRDAEHRHEVQTGGVPGWSWKEIEPLLGGLDALYVNFLSGVELDLETMQQVRARFKGPIYADLHSLFLSPASSRPRRPTPLARWREWLACFDAIQLNEDEMALLAPEELDRGAFERAVAEAGPRLVVVTEGGRGVRYVVDDALPDDPVRWRSVPPSGEVRCGELPAPGGRLPGDPTGCGDVWGAAFITGLLGGLRLEEAVLRAERLAAAKILHPETDGLRARLAEIVACEALA